MTTQEQIHQGILEKLRQANRYEPVDPDPERVEALRKSLAAAKRTKEREKERTAH